MTASILDNPDIGDLLRLRNYRTYSRNGEGWVDWSCAQKGELKRDKKVYLALLLGIEPLESEKTNEDYKKELHDVLGYLGFVGIDEAVAAGADPTKLGFEPTKPKTKKKAAKKKARRKK